MTSKFLHKQTEIQLLHEIRRNKQLKKNTRTDEQMDHQSQVKKYRNRNIQRPHMWLSFGPFVRINKARILWNLLKSLLCEYTVA